MYLITLFLDAIYIVEILIDALEFLQLMHCACNRLRDANEDRGLLDGRVGGLLDLMEDEDVRSRLDEVHDVVQPRCERVDVFSVEWSHEGRVEVPDDVVG